MRTSTRVWIVLAIIFLSIIADLAYSDALFTAGRTFDFLPTMVSRPVILIVFYMVISVFTVDLLIDRERNRLFSVFLIVVGLFVLWTTTNPFWLAYLPRTQIFNKLMDISAKLFSSRLNLTVSSGAIFAIVGFLRLLPAKFLLKKNNK